MSYIKPYMTDALASHRLAIVEESEHVKAYAMAKPGTGFYSVTVLECRNHLSLFGDITFNNDHGVVSTGGYGIAWFSGKKSEDYLCSKFLRQIWHWDHCEQSLKEIVAGVNDESDDVREVAKELISDAYLWEFDAPTKFEVIQELSRTSYDSGDGYPGYGYHPDAAGWLCAINVRFAELYADKAAICPSVKALHNLATAESAASA